MTAPDTKGSPATGPSNPPSILLVEDDPDASFLMKRALKHAGCPHRVVEARHGEGAIQLLGGDHANGDRLRPDFIFLDLNMPRMNGFELLAWLRDQPELAAIPAFVVSNSTHPQDHKRALELGAVACLEKPPQADVLRRLLKTDRPDRDPPTDTRI